MSDYQRPKPSIDVKIEEIPIGTFRVKLVGSIVNVGSMAIVVNDGTGQATLNLDRYSSDQFSVGSFGRFVVDLNKTEDKVVGTLISWTPMTQEQVKKYWKLVSIERRVPQ